MPMDKDLVDEFAEVTTRMVTEVLTYATLPADERDEPDEGQVRRLRGICGAMNSALQAIPPMTPRIPMMMPPEPLPRRQ